MRQQHEATKELETASSRALFYAPRIAFDRPVPKVPAVVFQRERDLAFRQDAATGFIALDLSATLGSAYPATTPTMLARYLVLSAGSLFSHKLLATGEVYYVLRGAGETTCSGEQFSWAAGDAFCLPGASETQHRSETGAILLLVTNEPELAYLHAVPAGDDLPAFRPTHFPKELTDAYLEEIHGRTGEQKSAGKSVVFLTRLMEERRVTTPTMLSSINTLEPGGHQRAHKHSSAAITLSIDGDDVHSMVDGQKVDWVRDAVFLTPPGAVHSHHNLGSRMMRSFVVQDTGLHAQLRTTNFSWTG